ncbi:MAG TPA: hypothetical protein VGJ86_12000 [Acidimicrobiales bacterium]|jgi:hypothetical protein
MTRVIDDVRDLLGALDPAPETSPDLRRLRARVLQRLDDPAPVTPLFPDRPVDQHRRPTRRLALACAAAVTLLAAAAVLVQRNSDDPSAPTSTGAVGPALLPLPEDEPAGPKLLELADDAAAVNGIAALPGSGYWYRSQARWDLFPEADALVTRTLLQLSELWRDGNGNRFETKADGPAISAGKTNQVGVDARPEGPPVPAATLHPDAPLLLPGGVEEAVAGVLTDGEEPFKSFFGALDIMKERVLPGEQLAEMYRLLAGIDGIRYRGGVVDRAGRHGQAFSITVTNHTDPRNVPADYLLIVDPADGRPLDIETVLNAPPPGMRLTTPAVLDFTVFLQVGQVGEPGERPALTQPPPSVVGLGN